MFSLAFLIGCVNQRSWNGLIIRVRTDNALSPEPERHPYTQGWYPYQQTTLETGGMERRSQPSSSADERGRLVAARDEPRPIQSCENETDPRGPRRVPAPPQIIITQGSHAIVAIDLSTQIHGELHTSQLGTFSFMLSDDEICPCRGVRPRQHRRLP